MNSRLPRGFTVVEIMVAVVIIGIMAAFAIPALAKSHQTSQAVRVVNDFKVVGQHFNVMIMQDSALPSGTYNENGNGAVPEGFDVDDLPLRIFKRPLNDNTVYSYDLRASLVGANQGGVILTSLNGYKIDLKLLTLIDSKLDDGDLTTGNVVLNGDNLVYVCYHD